MCVCCIVARRSAAESLSGSDVTTDEDAGCSNRDIRNLPGDSMSESVDEYSEFNGDDDMQ